MGELVITHETRRSPAMHFLVNFGVFAGREATRLEMERLAKTVEDVADRRWLVASDPDEHIEQLRPYLELGFTHLVFHAPGDGQTRFIELYGSQILPRIRKQWQ